MKQSFTLRRVRHNFKSALLKPHVVFILLALPFSIISSFATPVLTVADETQHLLRSYSVASGDISPYKQTSSTCIYPKSIATFYDAYRDSPTKKTQLQSISLNNSIDSHNTTSHICGTAASYSPVMYIPQSIGIFFANLFNVNLFMTVIVGRLCNALFFCLMMYLIIKWVKFGKWAFVAIGLLPISIHYAGSLSADPINSLVALGFVAFMFNLYAQRTKKISVHQTLALSGLVALLGLTKPQNLALLALLPFLPATLFSPNPKRIRHFYPNVQKWLTGAFALAIAVLAYKLSSMTAGAGPNTHAASDKILFNPAFFIHVLWDTYISPFSESVYNSFVFNGLVGGFSSYAWQLPSIITFLCMLTLVATLIYRDKSETVAIKQLNIRLVISSLLSVTLFISLITYAMYTIWAVLPMNLGANATFAEGVQGRYLTVGLILLLPIMLRLGTHIQIKPKHNYSFGCFVFVSFFITLSFYAFNSIQYLHLHQ